MILGQRETKIPYGVQHGKKKKKRERKKQRNEKKKDYRKRWDYWRKATDNMGEDQVKDGDK